ncbi:MAG TPA: sigma-54 dependent transcriptional regulator [Steroidobacteraceae bacterium]|nr:sigma-54 dependent transcriptional regulator [Steroidobacteraceae bacterium]
MSEAFDNLAESETVRTDSTLACESTAVTANALRAAQDLVAFAPASLRLTELARRVAQSDCTVLIAGESGVGKEVLAQFIHRNSPRAAQPFVAVNCAAIPDNMLEAMLFGYERGAYTGAHAAHAGKFEQAQGGSLLLDEVTEMPLGLQAKLLRVLQEREVERLGGRNPVALNVRVLATTNRNLRAEVAAGRFREDLYYRLNVFPLTVAALRDRREDVLPLAMRLLNTRCRPGQRIPALSADAAHSLLTYRWPGNVRELDNVMQRALILTGGAVIESDHIQFELGEAANMPVIAIPNDRVLANSLEQAEQELILEALRADNGNRQMVAKRLGISPRTLRYKLARLRDQGVAVPA